MANAPLSTTNVCHRTALIRVTVLLLTMSIVCTAGSQLEKANQLYQAGRLPDAIKAYKRGAIEGENPSLCYFNAANAYYQIDSLPQAVVLYKACVASAPDYAKGYLNLAVAYYALNDLANCISTAQRHRQLDPASQKGRLILAFAYRSIGDLAGAVSEFELLARDFPEMEEPCIALGEMYRDLEDYPAAEHWLEAYPMTGKNLDYVYGILADMREKQGDLPKALFDLQKAYSHGSPKPWTLYKIVSIQERLGNDLVAFETAREGMVRFPEFPDIAVYAGNLAFKRLRLEEAERCYTAAYKLGSPAAVVGLENVRSVRKERALAEGQ